MITPYKFGVSLLIALLAFNNVGAQQIGVPCDPDVDCPIDEYLVVLVIVILILSLKKISRFKFGLNISTRGEKIIYV